MQETAFDRTTLLVERELQMVFDTTKKDVIVGQGLVIFDPLTTFTTLLIDKELG